MDWHGMDWSPMEHTKCHAVTPNKRVQIKTVPVKLTVTKPSTLDIRNIQRSLKNSLTHGNNNDNSKNKTNQKTPLVL